ncbi:hypothetical protein K8352_08590 [Flavobacteriaceae bacterium F89]|uniref:Uncharacterized protein n=1 Tax=Cerina litoralis TaxID=2874477 RepID=A0AAE3EV07_9FLAO|nr:hypothetical protein [Cerina litoralis]MCG2460804.1 hypothetical protein [Cerina litoralis]
MELDKIEELLEKYFEATTTEAEEKSLRSYFSQKKVAPHLEQYAPLFQYFSNAREERLTKQVTLPPTATDSSRNLSGRGATKRYLYRWISVAAVAVLMFGIYFGKSYHDRKQAEYAYQETKKAFDLLAQNFGRGTEKMAYLKEFEVTKQKIYNND